MQADLLTSCCTLPGSGCHVGRRADVTPAACAVAPSTVSVGSGFWWDGSAHLLLARYLAQTVAGPTDPGTAAAEPCVVGVVGMACGTVRDPGSSTADVLRESHQLEVIGVDALRLPAQVIHREVIWDRTVLLLPSKSVRVLVLAT